MSDSILYNEEELLYKLSTGDETAFRTIFDWLAAPLHYFAFQIIHDQAEAEDMVSIAFHKLWEANNKYASLKSLRSFLYVTVKRQCIDRLRHQTVVKDAAKDLLASQNDQTESLDNEYIRAELLRLIYEEIKILPERFSTILEWTFLHELSTTEMAARLGLTESHVRADRSRGLQLLRTALSNKVFLFAPIGLHIMNMVKG